MSRGRPKGAPELVSKKRSVPLVSRQMLNPVYYLNATKYHSCAIVTDCNFEAVRRCSWQNGHRWLRAGKDGALLKVYELVTEVVSLV